MILALKKNSTPAQEETLLAYLHQMGVTAAKETCRGCTVLLLEGAVESLDAQLLSSLPAVEAVLPLDEPLPLSSRAAHGADTVVKVGPALVGGGHFCLMAGATLIIYRHMIGICVIIPVCNSRQYTKLLTVCACEFAR